MVHVNLILVGSDKITPTNVVNKIGTRMIALAAGERRLPMYAISDTSKFICEEPVGLKVRDAGTASDLWPEAPSGVTVLNSYFEPTPLANFTAIITEDGALPIGEAARRAREASIDEELLRALEVLRDGVR
jgi:translation initiation factor 2B subunit (eIF-2B alpha/beta/delta family)